MNLLDAIALVSGYEFILQNLPTLSSLLSVFLLLIWASLAFSVIYFVYKQLSQYNAFPCDNKHSLITGGSYGLGKAVAIELAKRGSNITILARNETKLKSAVQDIKRHCKNPKQKVEYVLCDVTDNQKVIDAFAKSKKLIGSVPDYVFAIAGTSFPAYMKDTPVEKYKSLMELNYLGAVYAVKEGSRLMIENNVKGGKLILCSSLAAFYGFIGNTAYCPTKMALRGLAEAMRQEMLLYEIDVHCMFPGSILTPGFVEENKIKPPLTMEIEGGEALSAEFVAKMQLDGIQQGQFMIVNEFIGELMRSLSLGLMPGNHPFFDLFFCGIGWWVGPLISNYFDYRVRCEAKRVGIEKKNK